MSKYRNTINKKAFKYDVYRSLANCMCFNGHQMSLGGGSSSEQVSSDAHLQQAQGPKTPRPIRSECTEWVRTWYARDTLVYSLQYYGGVRTMYGVSTEWVRTEGGVG